MQLKGRARQANAQRWIDDLESHWWLAGEIEKSYYYLKNKGIIQWTLVTAFYAALNYVDAILRGNGETIRRHEPRRGRTGHDNARNKLISIYLPDAFDHYKDLFEYSHQARYRPKEAKDLEPRDVNMVHVALLAVKKIAQEKALKIRA